MKKEISKWVKELDETLLRQSEEIILERVRNSKYKKHKYWVYIELSKWDLVASTIILLLIVPVGIGYFQSLLKAGIILFLCMILVGTIVFRHKQMEQQARDYDWIYEHRKVPEVYELTKQFTKDSFERLADMRLLRLRIHLITGFWYVFLMLYDIALMNLFIALPILYLFIRLVTIDQLDNYLLYIFDFDPPNKKDKDKKKKALTEVAARQWRDIIDRLKPASSPLSS